MAGQKQKRRLKKDLIMPAAAGILFAEMRPVLYGSLSASFDLPSSFTREEMARNNAAVASGSAAGNPEAYRCMLSGILEGSEMPRNVGRRFWPAYSPGADP
ncbi:hypothetical protein [Bacillus subtilis]|uniref:hypothetical protein n=1 Tax=Bacillus subtilis TaxID=1423 RepID=UPI002DB742E5|nr:hypothetical protein [Bacillus subtilis]MEC1977035.1 hypothetical protein [Bacillus subtilis]MEC2012176.1 hypothetical protein [Bacillus subtilis]